MFEPQVEQDAAAHARHCFPNESCGAVINGVYVPCENTHEQPEDYFRADAQILMRPGVQAFIHSHPKGNPEPSETDIQGQINTDIPWGIIPITENHVGQLYYYGTAACVPPLVGRPYRWGPSGTDGKGDCYALIKDYFADQGIHLNEYPREYNWWKKNPVSLYEKYFADEGFERVDTRNPQVGDVLIMKILAPITNHAAVYIGDGLMLHHAESRLSERVPAHRFMRAVSMIVRRKPDQ